MILVRIQWKFKYLLTYKGSEIDNLSDKYILVRANSNFRPNIVGE